MRNFLLIANEGKPAAMEVAGQVEEYLTRRGCICTREVTEGTQCVLVFGGDGTLLQAARDLREHDLPFLGINLGTLGYLAEVDKDDVYEALELVITDTATSEQRMMLHGRVCRGDQTLYEDVALNDIAIGSMGLTVLHFRVYVNGRYLTTYQGDGMVVATPTGSTAYSLSAGGPVVSPQASMMVLTPVSPHTLFSRSIVLEGDCQIELEILPHPSRQDVVGYVGLDGNQVMTLEPGDRIQIRRSELTTDIIKYNDLSFIETLRMKMGDR